MSRDKSLDDYKTNHNDGIHYDGHRNFGLTKREYFAAIAMQGFLANSYSNGAGQPVSEANRFEIAALAVGQADALIKSLNYNKPEMFDDQQT